MFAREVGYQSLVVETIQQAQVPLVFGSPAIGRHADGRTALLNSAYVLSPDGRVNGRYDKQHLVPFGEYVPLKSVLFFLDKLVEGIGDFQPGTGPTLLSIPHEAGPVPFGVAICYEVIFPDLVRRLAAEGAAFLVTLTNDAWFGSTVAPYQHFAMVVFRAVEHRLAFARAANTGISGVIAPTGPHPGRYAPVCRTDLHPPHSTWCADDVLYPIRRPVCLGLCYSVSVFVIVDAVGEESQDR